jgi:hypothetical protein
VVINYRLEWSEPKTRRSRRLVALDAGTVAALREHRKRQLEERLAWGPAYEDSGLVFAREDGSPVHPERSARSLPATRRLPVSSRSGSTI